MDTIKNILIPLYFFYMTRDLNFLTRAGVLKKLQQANMKRHALFSSRVECRIRRHKSQDMSRKPGRVARMLSEPKKYLGWSRFCNSRWENFFAKWELIGAPPPCFAKFDLMTHFLGKHVDQSPIPK